MKRPKNYRLRIVDFAHGERRGFVFTVFRDWVDGQLWERRFLPDGTERWTELEERELPRLQAIAAGTNPPRRARIRTRPAGQTTEA